MTRRASSPTAGSLSDSADGRSSGSAEASTAGSKPRGNTPEISSTALEEFFGPAWQGMCAFHDLLEAHGVVRGLIGPREVERLWTRHILNSAALAGRLPHRGSVADVGTGAGLPGVVLALMRPDLTFHLIEPMQRRIAWLEEVAATLQLENAVLHRARAADLRGVLLVDTAVARAVAPLDTLTTWALPLVRPGGRLLALKGRRALEELSTARRVFARFDVERAVVHEEDVLSRGEVTLVVELWKRG